MDPIGFGPLRCKMCGEKLTGNAFLSAEPAFPPDEQRQQDGPFRGYAVRLMRRGDVGLQGEEMAGICAQRQGVAGVR